MHLAGAEDLAGADMVLPGAGIEGLSEAEAEAVMHHTDVVKTGSPRRQSSKRPS